MHPPEIAAELGALKPFEDGYLNAVADELGIRADHLMSVPGCCRGGTATSTRRANRCSPVATKRQTRPVVCRNAAETGASISKTTKIPRSFRAFPDFAANRADFRPNAARLKIVVSPVRVRVSPFFRPAIPHGDWIF
jgi:hypothetical protein